MAPTPLSCKTRGAGAGLGGGGGRIQGPGPAAPHVDRVTNIRCVSIKVLLRACLHTIIHLGGTTMTNAPQALPNWGTGSPRSKGLKTDCCFLQIHQQHLFINLCINRKVPFRIVFSLSEARLEPFQKCQKTLKVSRFGTKTSAKRGRQRKKGPTAHFCNNAPWPLGLLRKVALTLLEPASIFFRPYIDTSHAKAK